MVDAGDLARRGAVLRRVSGRLRDAWLSEDTCGDTIQGTPLGYYYARIDQQVVHPMAATMNALNYDAATIGNHEFNYGLDTLNRKNFMLVPDLYARYYGAGQPTSVQPRTPAPVAAGNAANSPASLPNTAADASSLVGLWVVAGAALIIGVTLRWRKQA